MGIGDCVSALLYILLKGDGGEAYNIADEESNISIKELAETIAAIGGRNVVIDVPDDDERKGFNVVSKSIFDTKKISSLGWTVDGSMKDKLISTLEELKK